MSSTRQKRILRRTKLCLLTVCLLAPWQRGLFSQDHKVVVLENADSLVGRIIGGEEVRELIGHVRFTQENVRVTCDHALQYVQSGEAVLTGNVVVRDDSVTMRGLRGVYHRDERRAEAFDSVSLDDGTVKLTARYGEYMIGPKQAFFRSNVSVEDSASTVTADSLRYYRLEKRSVAEGNVTVHSASDNLTITGHHLEHQSVTQFSRMTENPVMVQYESSPSGMIDTLVVRSRVMEAYRDTVKRLLAIDSVEIIRSDLAAKSGVAEFYTQADSILLRRSPIVWYQSTQVSGDSINVYLKRRRLDIVSVMGNTYAISQSDSLYPNRFDQLTGEHMRLFFLEQTLDRIDVQVRAMSVYHLYEDSAANGLNKSSGDRIVIAVKNRKVRSIKIFGGVEGEYVPENLVHNREREHALPGFRWREDRPRIKQTDFPYRGVF